MEVAEMWPAAGAAAVAMCAISLLFAWLAAGTLRRYGAMDEEEAFSGVLWGLSPLISAYLFSWTAALSPAAPCAKRVVAVVACTACLHLLAVAADKLIAPFAGETAIVLAPLLSVTLRLLLRARPRRSPAARGHGALVGRHGATAASTLVYRSRAEEWEQESKVIAIYCVLAVPGAVGLCMALCFVAEWEAPSTEVVFFLAGPLIPAVRLLPPCMVGGAPVMANIDDAHVSAALIRVIGWVVVALTAGVNFGMVAGAVVFWVGESAMFRFLGYYLAVEAHCKPLMAIERKKQRRAKDASGLLDGRDSAAACSAHIDAAAGLCVDCVVPRCCRHTCRSQIIS